MGMDSKKENVAASRPSIPRHSPMPMVDPDLEMPGNTASAWAKPIKMASKNVIFTRFARENRVLHKIQPVAIKNPHTAIGLAKASLSMSLNKIPTTPAGMDPMTNR
jgi:hypothetical protein